MRSYTVVYYGRGGKGLKAFHVANATTETLQKAFDEADVAIIDHIIEQRVSIGEIDFIPIISEEAILNFINEWKLNY